MRFGDKSPIRVKDKEVFEKLQEGFEYCPKHVWKELVRNPNMKKKNEEEVKKPKKGNPKGKDKKTK